MKISFLLTFVAIVHLTANTVYSQNVVFSIKMENATVRDILKTVESKTNYRFFFSDNFADIHKKISIDLETDDVAQLLSKVFQGATITYKMLENNMIVITPKELQQGIAVTGNITDEHGEPMPGVNVVVKGTTIGVVTDINGKYAIEVPDKNAVLVFSFMGYTKQEVAVNDKQQVDIALKPDLMELEEVVVTGYWAQAKRDITGAIASISSDAIKERQPVNIFDALQGAAPGVQVLSNEGSPGSGANIRIRGASTLTDSGSEPLYIVDGVQMSITNINPNDIKSIEILKDAASAAIYGSRSANGVVIVTTKQGEEGKAKVDIQYLNSYSTLSNKIPQASRMEREAFGRSGNTGMHPHRNDSTGYDKNSDNYYQDLMTQTAVRNQVDLSVSGGSKELKYRGSLQYLDDEGIVINTYYKRLSGRYNMTYQPNDRWTLTSRLNFWVTDKTSIDERYSIKASLSRIPMFPIKYPDGSWVYYLSGQYNPISELYLRENTTKQYRGQVFQGVGYKITDWLRIDGDLAATATYQVQNAYDHEIPVFEADPTPPKGRFYSTMSIYAQGNLWATFSKTFDNAHHAMAVAGATFEKTDREVARIRGDLYTSTTVKTLNAAGNIFQAGDTYTSEDGNSLAGFFARVGYDYKSRYLLNATIRADGSSRFGSDSRWGYFPSASVGWRFSDEQFMEWFNNVLTNGMLRFSAGRTGQQSIGDYDAYAVYNFSNNYYGTKSIKPDTNMGNTLLQWETTTQYNAGIDLTFLNGRVALVGDYYVKNTDDLLYSSPLAYESGYNTVRTNLGSVQNKGIELMVTLRAVENRDLTWITSVNWSANKNKITYLPSGDRVDGLWWVGEGSEAGLFYGWKQHGVYAYNESNAWTDDFKTRLIPVFEKDKHGNVILNKAKEPNLLDYTLPDGTPYNGTPKQQSYNGTVLQAGDLIWEDLPDKEGNLDGDITDDDRQIIGKGHPSWFAGWHNTLMYKGFTLTFSFYGSFGNKVYNSREREATQYSSTNPTPTPYTINNMWKFPGQNTNAYRRVNFTGNNRPGGDLFLEDGSFIRLQNLRLGYQLKKGWARKAFMDNVTLYMYGNNLLTWTNYSGFDPEVNQSSVLNPGEDTGVYPRKREMGVGINIGF